MSEVPTITCQQCGYDLSNLKAEPGCSPLCPECGHITLPLSTTPNMHWASKATLRSIELGALLIRIGSYAMFLVPLLIVFLRNMRGANAETKFFLAVASAATGLATVLIGLFKLTTLDDRLAARAAETRMRRTRNALRLCVIFIACGAALFILVILTVAQPARNSMFDPLLKSLVFLSWVLIPLPGLVLLFAAAIYSRWLRMSESEWKGEAAMGVMSGILVLCTAGLFVFLFSNASSREEFPVLVILFLFFLVLFAIYLETFATTGRAASKLRKE